MQPTGMAEQISPIPLPDKPSIAVLPFTNMSGNREHEYFADGMTEDIMTGRAGSGNLDSGISGDSA